MEIITGDPDPVGQDGTGLRAHAFNPTMQSRKDAAEKEAIRSYLSMLRTIEARKQANLLYEMLECTTQESRFVKAVDKLQAMSFVYLRKQGIHEDQHLAFTCRYSEKIIQYYPGLVYHYKELRSRFLSKIAERRGVTVNDVEALIVDLNHA